MKRSVCYEYCFNYFGCMVFDDRVMKANLSADVYASLRRTIDEGAKLDASVANAVAAASEGLGCRPWRDPLYPLVPAADRHHRRKARQLHFSAPDGGVIMDFSGKELIMASLTPLFSLRAACAPPLRPGATPHGTPPPTHSSRARPFASPRRSAPTAAEALDKKTPLLRSVEALNRQAYAYPEVATPTSSASAPTSA